MFPGTHPEFSTSLCLIAQAGFFVQQIMIADSLKKNILFRIVPEAVIGAAFSSR